MELSQVSVVAIMSGFSGKTKLCVRSPRFVLRLLTLAERMDRWSKVLLVLLVPDIIPEPAIVWHVSRVLVWLEV